MGNNNVRRRQIIVNEPLQRRLILTSMWMPCLCLAALSAILTYFCVRLHQEAIDQNADLTSIVPVFAVTVGFVVVAITFTIVHGVRLSHRIAGPIVNFERTIGRFMAGETDARVQLRKMDLLVDAADQFNILLAWTEERLKEQGADASAGAEDAADAGAAGAATTADELEATSSANDKAL